MVGKNDQATESSDWIVRYFYLEPGWTFYLIHVAAAFILITVSSIHLKIQRMIQRQFYELPLTQVDTLLRAKLNNILSMARNSFSCFDFFEIKQQFIMAVNAFFLH